MKKRPLEAINAWYKVISDLQGHLEVTMAPEVTKMALRQNIHMDNRVKEDA